MGKRASGARNATTSKKAKKEASAPVEEETKPLMAPVQQSNKPESAAPVESELGSEGSADWVRATASALGGCASRRGGALALQLASRGARRGRDEQPWSVRHGTRR